MGLKQQYQQVKGHGISRYRRHPVQLSGKGPYQTETETLKSGCWWPEEKINLEAARTSLLSGRSSQAALPDRQIQDAMTLNRCKQAVSAVKFCY